MPETEDAGLIDDFLREPLPPGTKSRAGGIKIKVQDLTAGKALLALKPDRRVDAAVEVLLRLAETARIGTVAPGQYERRERLKNLAGRLLSRKLQVDDERMARLAEAAAELKRYYLLNHGPVARLVYLCEEHVERVGLSARLHAALETIAESLEFARAPEPIQQRLAVLRQRRP